MIVYENQDSFRHVDEEEPTVNEILKTINSILFKQ